MIRKPPSSLRRASGSGTREELAVPRPATELLKGSGGPEERFAAIEVMVAEAPHVGRVAGPRRIRVRALRPASTATVRAGDPPRLVTDLIGQIDVDFRDVVRLPACVRRAHPRPPPDRGRRSRVVTDAQVRSAWPVGPTGGPAHANQTTASDLGDQDCARSDPDRLRVTDISGHPHPRGHGVPRRRARRVLPPKVVGWSIDSTQNAALCRCRGAPAGGHGCVVPTGWRRDQTGTLSGSGSSLVGLMPPVLTAITSICSNSG
jgi:hypothetical protein